MMSNSTSWSYRRFVCFVLFSLPNLLFFTEVVRVLLIALSPSFLRSFRTLNDFLMICASFIAECFHMARNKWLFFPLLFRRRSRNRRSVRWCCRWKPETISHCSLLRGICAQCRWWVAHVVYCWWRIVHRYYWTASKCHFLYGKWRYQISSSLIDGLAYDCFDSTSTEGIRNLLPYPIFRNYAHVGVRCVRGSR